MGVKFLNRKGWLFHLFFKFFILLVSFLSSCSETYTEKEGEHLIVMSGGANNLHGITASFFFTQDLDDTLANAYLKGLEPVLYIDGAEVGRLMEHTSTRYYTSTSYYSCYLPKPGQRIGLKVSADDKQISGETTFPYPVKIDSIQVDYLGENTLFTCVSGDYNYEARIIFADPAGEENYYSVSAESSDILAWNQSCNLSDSFPSYWPVYLHCTDAILEPHHESTCLLTYPIYFSDKQLSGKSYTLKVFFYSKHGPDEQFELKFTLATLCKNRFLSTKSDVIYQKAQEDYFSEPVTQYSNISGGIGVVSASSINRFTVIVN